MSHYALYNAMAFCAFQRVLCSCVPNSLPGIGDEVGLELGQVDIEGPIEPE